MSIQERFAAGEDVADELHKLLSRWLFSHIRTEDHAYTATVKKYLNRVDAAQRQGAADAETRYIDYEKLFPELEHRMQKKGWLARLFGR